MQNFVADFYLWIKALHIIAVISWMAGMLYLPRLYVYHVSAKGVAAKMLETMERRLLKIIINPAMILTFIFGGLLVYYYIVTGNMKSAGWLHTKIVLVLIMAGLHGFFSASRKRFLRSENNRSEKFWRLMNEIPALLMIAIVILAVVKPF